MGMLAKYQNWPWTSGGGADELSSLTHFVLPADMNFSGANFVGVTDRVAASSTYVSEQGSMTGDNVDGLIYTEATAGSNWMRLNGLFPETDPAPHLMISLKRNATADDSTIVLYHNVSNFYAAQNGATTPGSAMGGTTFNVTDQWLDGLLIDGRGGTPIPSRDTVWDNVFADTEISVIGFEGLTSADAGNVGLLTYTGGGAFAFEGRLRGWARFTDWSQRAAVAAALKGT